MMVRLLVVLVVALTASPPAAEAYWTAGGSGVGTATVETLAAADQPTATASGQNVTVQWSQTQFRGSSLGSFTGGGYTVTRYADGASTGATPNASCQATVTGSGASLQCTEASRSISGAGLQGHPACSGPSPARELAERSGGSGNRCALADQRDGAEPGCTQSTGDIVLVWSGGDRGDRVQRLPPHDRRLL